MTKYLLQIIVLWTGRPELQGWIAYESISVKLACLSSVYLDDRFRRKAPLQKIIITPFT